MASAHCTLSLTEESAQQLQQANAFEGVWQDLLNILTDRHSWGNTGKSKNLFELDSLCSSDLTHGLNRFNMIPPRPLTSSAVGQAIPRDFHFLYSLTNESPPLKVGLGSSTFPQVLFCRPQRNSGPITCPEGLWVPRKK